MRAPAPPSPSPPLPPAAGGEGSAAPRAESVVLRGTLRGVAPAAAQRLWLRRAWNEGRGLPWPGATVAARGGQGGEGCVRIVGLGLAEETIVGVEEGTAIYKVTGGHLPLRDHLGTVSFSAAEGAAGTELVWHIEFTRSWWAAALPVASLIRLVIGRCVRNLERAAARGAEKEGGGGK